MNFLFEHDTVALIFSRSKGKDFLSHRKKPPLLLDETMQDIRLKKLREDMS